jgi:pantetheine-phosphate adenylyltransferase
MVKTGRKLAAGHATIDVQAFDTLLVKFAAQVGVGDHPRPARGVDFEKEFQMVAIASRLVKEIAAFGGDVAQFTTPAIAKALKKRYAK